MTFEEKSKKIIKIKSIFNAKKITLVWAPVSRHPPPHKGDKIRSSRGGSPEDQHHESEAIAGVEGRRTPSLALLPPRWTESEGCRQATTTILYCYRRPLQYSRPLRGTAREHRAQIPILSCPLPDLGTHISKSLENHETTRKEPKCSSTAR